MTLNTKDLYLGNVGVGTTSPYQTVPATAIVNEFGEIISEFTISAGIVTVTNIVNEVEIKNDSGNPIPTVTGLEIPEHDYISMSYTGVNLTGVVYKTGGSGGTTVATLTLAYDGSDNLISVTKS